MGRPSRGETSCAFSESSGGLQGDLAGTADDNHQSATVACDDERDRTPTGAACAAHDRTAQHDEQQQEGVAAQKGRSSKHRTLGTIRPKVGPSSFAHQQAFHCDAVVTARIDGSQTDGLGRYEVDLGAPEQANGAPTLERAGMIEVRPPRY